MKFFWAKFEYDIVSDIIGILFRSCRIFSFWVVTACVKGIYFVYKLIIKEQYINPLN